MICLHAIQLAIRAESFHIQNVGFRCSFCFSLFGFPLFGRPFFDPNLFLPQPLSTPTSRARSPRFCDPPSLSSYSSLSSPPPPPHPPTKKKKKNSPPPPLKVIKVGTSSLLHPASLTLNLGNLARICETARDLVGDGHRVVLVSSGAVGAGAARLGLASRPSDLAAKQALAAIGQVHLMRHYDDFLSALRLTCAQVLLTLDNLAVRSQWRAAASTFEALFAAGGVVPVVNENDTVAVAELRIGDNDTLSAQVATLVRADWLFLMTDVDALYTANPAADPKAARVAEVHDLSALAVNTTGEADGGGASASTSASRGGGGGGGGGGGTERTLLRVLLPLLLLLPTLLRPPPCPPLQQEQQQEAREPSGAREAWRPS